MSRSLHLRAVKIKLSFPQQIVEEHEHVRDTTHPPEHYGRIYVTHSLYEVTFPMSYRNVGSSCPHYRERRRSPNRTDSDALYAVGGGNTGPASSVTTNFTPYYLDKKHRREDTPVSEGVPYILHEVPIMRLTRLNGGRSHRISPSSFCGACLNFLARRIQPFLSLVDREVEFCVPTN